MMDFISEMIGMAVFITFLCIFLFYWIFSRVFKKVTIYEYQKGLKYHRGKFDGILEPGQYWIYASADTVTPVDIRSRYISVPGQELVSSDGISLKMTIAAQYSVSDPVKAINEVENYHDALYLALQIRLRDIVQDLAIDEIMSSRSTISEKLLEGSKMKAGELGLTLHSASVKDFMLPGELKKVFAQVVNARKEGLAALEKARGETAALRNLVNASSLLEKNPALLSLRVIQSVESSKGNTVVLGMPHAMTPLPMKGKGNDPEELQEPQEKE